MHNSCEAGAGNHRRWSGQAESLADLQVLEDEMVLDLPQWLAESSAGGQSAALTKRFSSINPLLTAVSLAAHLRMTRCEDQVKDSAECRWLVPLRQLVRPSCAAFSTLYAAISMQVCIPQV